MAFTSERSHLGGTDKGVSTPEKGRDFEKRVCFRDGESVASDGAEASTASKKLAVRSCTRSAGMEGAMARKMRRQAHPSFACSVG